MTCTGGLQVFPNPCTGTACLRVTRHSSHVTSIDLYSISGLRIRELLNEVKMPGEYELEIDVSDLAPGIYIVRLQAGEQTGIRKLIVE
ncbi:MAG: T9SS type A sorting domain-containing protein [Bacteroidota bacterium]|nr:T9SS type A sorting domain-containing protein [Bacteroidota bacterium]